MFGWLKKQKVNVINHWFASIPEFSFSTVEFYDRVEKSLKQLELPAMEISRVEFSEAGIFSDKRIYLRMIRERFVFDVCAAPFGTTYFFSCRLAEFPLVVSLWVLLAMGLLVTVYTGVLLMLFGLFYAVILFVVMGAILLYCINNPEAIPGVNLDNLFLRIPVINQIYQAWFRKETYFRHDTRVIFLEVVSSVIKQQMEEVVASKGVKLIKQYENSPVLSDLYKPNFKNLG